MTELTKKEEEQHIVTKARDVEDVPVYYDPEIPDHAWNYIIHVRSGLVVTTKDDREIGFRENYEGIRSIVNGAGEVVGYLPAGLPRWSGDRAGAEEFLQTHPSRHCLEIVRVLMLVHPEDLQEVNGGDQ